MSAQPFDFSTANFDVSERGIIGSTSLGPIVRVRIGLGLFRAIYEYRNAGIAAGGLEAGPPAWPNAILAPINMSTRITLAPGLTQTTLAADPSTPATLDHLTDDLDDVFCHAIIIDGSYTTGAVACPEIKTWCEALGGVYSPEIPAV